MFTVHDKLGMPLSATFDTETQDGVLTLVLHSAGGSSRGGGRARNADYPVALELLLGRLGGIKAVLAGAYVDSRPVQSLPISARRLEISQRYPIYLSEVSDFDELRRSITRAQSSVGSSASRGGNERRRIRLVLDIPSFDASDAAAERLGLVLSHSQGLAATNVLPQQDQPALSHTRRGQGFLMHKPTQLAVEALAMAAARDYYKGENWKVEDVSHNHSFDLLCTRDGAERRVEVKGTTQAYSSVLLTPNEVAHALANPDLVALYVVSEIMVTDVNGTPVASGGVHAVHDPWILDPARLTPTGYSYALE